VEVPRGIRYITMRSMITTQVLQDDLTIMLSVSRYDEGYRSRLDSNPNSNRFSMVSDSEPSYTPPTGYPGAENDQYNRLPTVQLPPPLGRAANASPNPSPSRSSIDTYTQDTSRQRLISTPPSAEYSHEEEPVQSPSTIESQVNRMPGGVLRQSTISTQYPIETSNPYRFSQPQAASYDDHYSAEPEEEVPRSAAPFIPPAPQGFNNSYNGYRQQQQQRGISLADNGPVSSPSADGVRRVARQQARRSTQQNPPPSGANRYSRSSTQFGGGSNMPTLPPGAAAPNPYGYR